MNSSDGQPDGGGHMSFRFGRIASTLDLAVPYRAMLTDDQCAQTECSFAAMREAEAFTRHNSPLPRARSALRHRDALAR